MKNNLKYIGFILSTIMIFSIFNITFCRNKVNAVEIIDLPSSELSEATIKVSSTGIKAEGNYKNALTAHSDIFLDGLNIYTVDSATNNDFNGVKPGGSVTGELGCIFVDSNGDRVESLQVNVQIFKNTNKAGIVDGMAEFLEGIVDRETITDYVYSQPDLVSSKYGEYKEQKYECELFFNKDGTFTFKLSDEIPDNYLIAITEIENPETGEMQNITDYFRLFLALGDGSNSNPGTSGEEAPAPETNDDDGHRYYNKTVDTILYKDMDPACAGSISSNIYDVSAGIPTSENLNYYITADNALYDIMTRKITLETGVKDITIKVYATYKQKHTSFSYNESGEKIEKSWYTTEKVEKVITKDYDYSDKLTLYDVPISSIYPVTNGSIQATNTTSTLNSGSITLTGSLTPNGQTLSVTIGKPNVNDVVEYNLGHFSSKSSAKKAVNNSDGYDAKSDINAAVKAARSFLGNINYSYYGLNVTTTTHNNTKPVVAKTTGSSLDKMIPSTYPNGTYISRGSVLYTGGYSFGITPNNVIVHTPVVNNSKISSTSKFINQKINIDETKTYLMLDEQFTIKLPDEGVHNNIKGYGNRTYNSWQGVTAYKTTWGKIKDVKLPFDTYLHYTKNGQTYKYFIKANTWLSDSAAENVTSLSNNSYTFTIPVWVEEKTYDIETRVIAENADKSSYELKEDNKNGTITNYVAYNKIPVEIIGKIYDLRVSASNDPAWSNIYSQKNKTTYIKADEFPFGAQGQNRNIAYKYAPKLGYTFVFDFKTKGIKSNNIDVSVQPEGFYFVSKDGTTTNEVDLYYNTTTKKNIQITTADNNVNLTVKLREAFMKVAAQEFIDSTRIYNNKYNYALGVNIGTFAKMNLPHNLRLCYNNFAEYINILYGKGSTEKTISSNAGSRDTVIGSVGHWYAGYRLPASTRAVIKDTNINDAIKNNLFLKDGYIVVKFNIKTKYQNLTGNYDYLRYMGPEAMNEAGDNTGELIVDWTKGGTQTITLPNGNKATVPVGSVAIFDADLRSSNDAEVGGTH